MRLLILILAAGTVFAEERATVTGQIFDAAGKPLENALVMIYSAGAKKGYSIVCPTCYRDCGKRTTTGPDGRYKISGLDSELIFTLVAAKDGYLAEYIWSVDPAKGEAMAPILKARPAVLDELQVVRARLVTADGTPVRDAVIQPDFVWSKGPDGRLFGSGQVEWINQVTVSNERGEFEVAYEKPVVRMTIRVGSRGMAPAHFTATPSKQRATFVITEGAVIRGRLVYKGKPVANAEIGLAPHDSTVGRWYPEMRVGTREDGRFAITNVPPGRIWSLYPKMESLASREIGGDVVICQTKGDGDETNVGDVKLTPAYTIRGRIELTDGKPLSANMHVTLSETNGIADSQVVPIGSDGAFELRAVPGGIYMLSPGVWGYRLESETGIMASKEVAVNGDVKNLVIRMEPDGN